MARALSIDVFAYLSYRAFLRDAYLDLKARQRGFSYRWFAKRAGLSSPNFLKLVVDGKRNLSPRGAEAFAIALGLTGREASFFRELVDFEQAANDADKNRAWERLASYQGHRQVRSLERQQLEHLSTWWHSAILELVELPGCRDDPEWIARQLRPPISTSQARAALARLLALGLVARDGGGRVRRAAPERPASPEVRALAEGNLQRQMLQRAAEALELIEPAEREITATTVALSPDAFALVKQKLRQLRAEVIELAAREPLADRVIQVNLQAFPLAVLDATTIGPSAAPARDAVDEAERGDEHLDAGGR